MQSPGHSDEAILQAAVDWVNAGHGVALATVLRTWGSAPREAGSHMVINDRGDFLGSVSGGCVETAVIETAQEVIRARTARTLSFGVTNERAWEVGLACGGTVEILVAPVARLEPLTTLLERIRERRPMGLATRLADGSLTVFAPESVPAQEGLFLRTCYPPVRLLVVGGVHIAAPLADMATIAGCDVWLIDPREAFNTELRFPRVQRLVLWPEEALARLRPDGYTAVVTLTHQPRLDDDALAAALATDAFYLGALGSRKTHAARLGRLRARGFGDEALTRIHGPAGLDIRARTPAEIAVAILAEVVAALRGREQS